MTDWRFKIFAYLHDPPDKPFALGRDKGHAAWGRELACMIADPPDPGWDELIQQADRLASGADRSIMLPRTKPSLRDLRHPLSGQRVDLSIAGEIGHEAEEQARQALLEEFRELEILKSDPAAAFIALWCILPRRLRSRRGQHELGALWDWIPAETRMPNHAISVHQSLTSALASILKEGDEPALLSFSIGPVQKFISAARRTSDLWGGSALLSSALLQALIPVATQIGPDHILFPNLRRTDAFLRWILKESKWKDSLGPLLTMPAPGMEVPGGLPNRFLAVIPSSSAGRIAAQCEQSVRDWWRSQARIAAAALEEKVPELQGFRTMAEEQADAFLQVFWAATPWPAAKKIALDDEACARASWIRHAILPESTVKFIEASAAQRRDCPTSAFIPNGGLLYAAAYESVETLVGAAKLTRLPSARPEEGLKCSLCGERGVFPGKSSFEEQKEAWRSGASHLHRKGDLRRGEALCGVCWTKRYFGRQSQIVPSTAEIAALPFKMRVLQNFDRLEAQVSALITALQHNAPRFLNAYVAPAMLGDKQQGGLHGAFAGASGEILLGYPREKKELEEETGAEIPEVVFDCVANLRRAARKINISPPRPYLAVLILDGDEMGKWLSGAKNRALREYLSEEAIADLSAQAANDYLDIRWPMTPAMHSSFSEACAVFSQRTALRTMHEDGMPAFLVYSGGDDALALIPTGCDDPNTVEELATQAAFNLRMRFSGHVRREGTCDVPDPDTQSGFVLDSEGLSLAFGKDATASAGIAVFHYKWPLGRALQEARNAEEYAKESLGRDALAISILRRSGQTTFTGMKFFAREKRSAIPSFQKLSHAFAFDILSPRFLSEVRARLEAFSGGLGENELLNLAAPIITQAMKDHCHDASKLYELNEASNDLRNAATSSHCRPGDAKKARIPADLQHLRRWIDLIDAAAFLGRGEEA
jgi:CRISPR-associated protein Cmr2